MTLDPILPPRIILAAALTLGILAALTHWRIGALRRRDGGISI